MARTWVNTNNCRETNGAEAGIVELCQACMMRFGDKFGEDNLGFAFVDLTGSIRWINTVIRSTRSRCLTRKRHMLNRKFCTYNKETIKNYYRPRAPFYSTEDAPSYVYMYIYTHRDSISKHV